MGLGGYKYAGCSVQKSDFTNLTDNQWALAVHKCRVKAFVASLERSGASWVCSRTDGDIDLDSTHTGYIHIILPTDTSSTYYPGYATYFKYVESNQDKAFYLILTLPRWQFSASSSNVVNVDMNICQTDYYTGTSFECKSTCFHALSLEDFGTHPKYNDYISSKSTLIVPVGAKIGAIWSTNTSQIWGQVNSNVGYMSSNAVSFGYSTKNGTPDIESFAKGNNNSSGGWNVTVMSANAITNTVSQSDSYKLGTIELRSGTKTITYDTSDSEANDSTNTINNNNSLAQFLRSDGTVTGGIDSTHIGTNTQISYNFAPEGDMITSRVYSAFCLSTTNPCGTDTNVKGYFNVELAAFSWQSSNLWEKTSNGAYICINNPEDQYQPIFGGGVDDKSTLYIYIGWDSLNPNMLSSDACPIYIPDVTFPAS